MSGNVYQVQMFSLYYELTIRMSDLLKIITQLRKKTTYIQLLAFYENTFLSLEIKYVQEYIT